MLISDYPVSTLITLATSSLSVDEGGQPIVASDQFLEMLYDTIQTLITMDEVRGKFVHLIWNDNIFLFSTTPSAIQQLQDLLGFEADFVKTIGSLSSYTLNNITFLVKL